MMGIRTIFKAAAAMSAVCVLLATSCEKPVDGTLLEVSVKSASVPATSGSQFVTVKCSGSWTLALAGDKDVADWASLSTTSGKGDANNIILRYSANTTAKSRTLKIVLDDGSRWVVCSVAQAAAGQTVNPDPDDEQETDPDPGVDPDPTPTPGVASTGWLELPAMDDPALGYYSHSFKMNGRTYRNYTFGWSQKDLVSLWMAYPLCSMYTNKAVSRTNDWDYDPLLGSSYSSAPFGGYGGDYARGHQVPSADRLCCYEANAQTFYGTNMTPQLNRHNEGVWQNLESQVRTWANTSDTTYVVTGCVVEGSTKFTTDSDGKKMTVPVAYFKALVRYHKASTISQWAGAAFYLEHRAYGDGELNITKNHEAVMSIDELEEMLGLDLFVNLPSRLGADQAAKVEAQNPASVSLWW